jgi:hypothetical protein
MLENALLQGLALLSIGEFFNDMFLVLKIFVVLTIASWVVMHLGKGPLSIVVIVGFTYLMLFSPWTWFFEGAYVLLMLFMLGFAGIFIDMFFVFPGFAAGPAGGGAPEAKMSSQGGVMQRMRMFNRPPGPRKLPPPM